MGNCLVTKLKGAVDNSNLMKIGEIEFDVEMTGVGQPLISFSFSTNTSHTVRVLDGGFYIIDMDGNNVGDSYTVNGTSISFRLPNDLGFLHGKMSVTDSYDITRINAEEMHNGAIKTKYMQSLVDYITEDAIFPLNSVEDFFNKEHLRFVRTRFKGDNNDVTKIQCPVSNTCDIREKTTTNFVGDISKVNTGVHFLLISGQFTWETGRPSGSPVLVLQCSNSNYGGCNLGDYVDAYLNNCVSGTDPTEPEEWYKGIVIYGNRTSASDAAVAALKARGYSITVNNIEL